MIPLLDWFTPVLVTGSSIHGGGELLLLAASAGAVGMGLSDIASGLSDRISGAGGDESEFAGDDEFGSDGGGFGDDEFGGFDDDEFGGFDEEGDDLDEWSDDEGLDDFGGDGGGGGNADLEPRLDELENEVATISSTMGTVRSENEAINETVEDIEDNIRKLLDIYEMVTRGVNPFVDDTQASGGMGGSFGLFDDTDDDDGGLDDIDPDVADADADSFFDDDFDADSFDDEGEFGDDDFPMGDDDSPPAGADDATAGDAAPAASGDGSADGGDGKTFDELKSEYETGSPDWDGDDAPRDDTDATIPDQEPDAATGVDDATPPEGVDTAPDPADLGGVEEALESADSAGEETTDTADEPSGAAGGADQREASPDASTAADEKPYLESLPSGYGAELLVVEWLTYLRGRSSTPEALRAINYYRNIGWIGAPAANSLQEYLSGLGGEEVTPTSTGGTQLTIDHHTDSLRYIGKLCGKHVDVERLEWSGSGRDGGRIERRGQRGIQR